MAIAANQLPDIRVDLDADGQRIMTVSNFSDRDFGTLDAEVVKLVDCVEVVVAPTKTNRRIEIRGGSDNDISAGSMNKPVDNKTVFIEAWDSPGIRVDRNTLDGAGILVWDSPGATAMQNKIQLRDHTREGIQFRGCDGFSIGLNRVRGTYGQGNDHIQVGPTAKGGNPGMALPWKWGGPRDFVRFEDPGKKAEDGWSTFHVPLYSGPNAGKTVYWAFETGRYVNGGRIFDNDVEGGGVAGVFVWNAYNVKVTGNRGRNFVDYTFGLEWCLGSSIDNNTAVQDPDKRNRQKGTQGGVAIMNMGVGNVAANNTLVGCHVDFVPWSMPQFFNVASGNHVTDGYVRVSYVGDTIEQGIRIVDNTLVRGQILTHNSPSYVTGEISRNKILEPGRYGITMECFQGVVKDNVIGAGCPYPVRTWNNGSFMASEILAAGNVVGTKPAELRVTGKTTGLPIPVEPGPAVAGDGSATL